MLVQQVQHEVHRRVNARLLPLFFLTALLCQLDRSNLSFAALQLRNDFKWFTSTVQGVGSGLFFIGYLAQLGSQLACVAMGARRWLAVILVAWGCVAMSFATLQGTVQFLLLRLLLGLTESGAYPGMYYHLSLFYQESELGVAYTWVATATAVAGLLGGPMAAALMSLDGQLGLRGWQWLFLVEGVTPLLLAVLLWVRLPDSPLSAAFLSPTQRSWLHQYVHGELGLELAALPPLTSPSLAEEGPGSAAPLAAGAAAGAAGRGSEGGSWHELNQEQLLPRGASALHALQPAIGGSHSPWQQGPLDGSTHADVLPGATDPSDGFTAEEAEARALLAGEAGEARGPSHGPWEVVAPASASAANSSTAAAATAMGVVGVSGVQRLGSRGLLRRVLTDWQVWELGAIMWTVDFAMNAVHFFLPTIIWDLLASGHGEGEGGAESGPRDLHQVVLASMLAALPFAGAGACMVLVAFSSKRHMERRLHTAVPMGVAACAFGALAPLAHWLGMAPALICLTVAAGGIWSTHAPLFSWPAQLMEPQAGAIAFAAMKTMGALGGFAGPSLVGILAQGGSVGGAMLLLGGVCGVAALVVTVFPPQRPVCKPPASQERDAWQREQEECGKHDQLDC